MAYIDYEGDSDCVYSTGATGETFQAILRRRLSRRSLAAAGAATVAVGVTGPQLSASTRQSTPVAGSAVVGALGFAPIVLDSGPDPVVAEGYVVKPLLRWGEPILAGAPAFDPATQTAAAQEMQAGYNCDVIAFIPLPYGSNASDRGLLVVMGVAKMIRSSATAARG